MKHLLILLACAAAPLLGSAQAPTVPAKVKQAFEQLHPGQPAHWEREGRYYEAEFKQNGKETSVILDEAGTLIETESHCEASEIPAAAMKHVQTQMAPGTSMETEKITKANGDVFYEVEVKGKSFLYDSKGKLVSQEDDDDAEDDDDGDDD